MESRYDLFNEECDHTQENLPYVQALVAKIIIIFIGCHFLICDYLQRAQSDIIIRVPSCI